MNLRLPAASLVPLLLFLPAFLRPAVSQEPVSSEENSADLPAGHSLHGEAFNEGPRQAAYLMGGCGDVHFPATCNDETAQKFVDQGIGQLHGFWYLEAERSFRQAAALDPDCGIAYWGAAYANKSNKKRAVGFLEEAIQRKDKLSERENMYVDALDAYLKADPKKSRERDAAFAQAMEAVALEFPDDLEAKAFLALHLYYSRDNSTSYLAVDGLIQEILRVNPLHPVHHFRIHLWDNKKAEVALDSAARCGQSSPSIAHMWHMPGHIYSKLKRYDDACWHQEASARADHAHMMRDRVMPDEIHNFAHNNEWLIRDLMNVGRVQDAIDLAINMTELPRHPKYNTLDKRGSAYYGRTRLLEALYQFERWDDLIALSHQPCLEPTDKEWEQVRRLRHLGAAYFRSGRVEKGDEQIAILEQRLVEARSELASPQGLKPGDDAGGLLEGVEPPSPEPESGRKSPEEIRREQNINKKIADLEKQITFLRGHKAVAAGDVAAGIELLQKGGEDRLVLARLRCQAGDAERAINEVRAHVLSNKNEVLPAAALVEVLWMAGNKAEAEQAMEQLRDISGSIDMQSPVFERITAIAAEMRCGEDWQLEPKTADDIGQRPPLDSLGPFRWRPSPAADWTLKDSDGRSLSLKQFQGRPLLLIFYLGHGCLHCVEQLHAFGPRVEAFDKAGISIVAIGTDEVDSLSRAIDDYDGPLPIPLLSDAKLDVFKAYRAFDDFEDQPLHGTFLIDEKGDVRWQDISYEPFMDTDFLLEESDRLLAQPRP